MSAFKTKQKVVVAGIGCLIAAITAARFDSQPPVDPTPPLASVSGGFQSERSLPSTQVAINVIQTRPSKPQLKSAIPAPVGVSKSITETQEPETVMSHEGTLHEIFDANLVPEGQRAAVGKVLLRIAKGFPAEKQNDRVWMREFFDSQIPKSQHLAPQGDTSNSRNEFPENPYLAYDINSSAPIAAIAEENPEAVQRSLDKYLAATVNPEIAKPGS